MSLMASIRRLFTADRPEFTCPICLCNSWDEEPGQWSGYYGAFVHVGCVPTVLRHDGVHAVGRWLETGVTGYEGRCDAVVLGIPERLDPNKGGAR